VIGFQAVIGVDRGVEFDLDLWAQRAVTPDFSAREADRQCKFRGECPNAHRFMTLDDASENARQ
jgi:hypothetical protein